MNEMEIIGILLVVLVGVMFLKLFAVFFQVGIFVLTLPLKILAFALSGLLVFFVFIPLGLVAGIVGLIVVPFALLTPLLPLVLIGLGIWALARRR